MFSVNKRLSRNGGNQLGVLVMAAGLIAYFIEPSAGVKELGLVSVGFMLFVFSVMMRRPKVDAGKTTVGPSRR